MKHPKIYGTAGDDTIKGTDGGDSVLARSGDDLVFGRGGSDTLTGEAGADTLFGGGDALIAGSDGHADSPSNSLVGGGGNDYLSGGVGDTELGGVGDDHLIGRTGEGGLFDGGAGHDSMLLSLGQATAYNGDLGFLAAARGEVQVDGATLRSLEGGSVGLTGGDDVVTLAADVHGWSIGAGAGNDRLTGNGHADSMNGGAGDNTLVGGGGDDVLTANAGFDNHLKPIEATLFDGGSGDDTILGYGTLNGGDGNDLLTGAGVGGSLLSGGAGADTLDGRYSDQTLEGGAGRDVYLYHGVDNSRPDMPDHIIDEDFGVVDLSLVDAVSGTRRDNAFTLVHAFTGHAGELTITYQSADDTTHVKGDVDGDGQADLVILIAGDHTDPADYVL